MVIIGAFNLAHVILLSTLSRNTLFCGCGNLCVGPVLQFLLVQLLEAI